MCVPHVENAPNTFRLILVYHTHIKQEHTMPTARQNSLPGKGHEDCVSLYLSGFCETPVQVPGAMILHLLV